MPERSIVGKHGAPKVASRRASIDMLGSLVYRWSAKPLKNRLTSCTVCIYSAL
jgi:hypothetical protein